MPSDADVALVTGASSGIGRETARTLAADGYRLVLAARRDDELRELADEIERDGGRALVAPTDVTDGDEVTTLVETATDEFGRVDVLVNAAGAMTTDPVTDADTDDWRQMVDVNLLGLMDVTRAVVPEMVDRGDGHVVMISSVNARKPSPTGSGYCASKAGVNGFAESLRQEVAADGVRVTVVEPGMVETEMQPPDVVEKVPMLDPGAVADAVAYAVAQPPSVSVNELLVRPTAQEF